ncbi:MAG: hypothetical protein J1F01_03815 [Oscillospiraceae bacterium]|nr:hypothetical protein [Oscillospiraceae bacterium]
MEIKRVLTAISVASLMVVTAAGVQAADDVIYESGRTEAKDEFVDLSGWGYELFTRSTFEADVQFKDIDSGITLRSEDNTKGGTSIRAVDRNGTLTMAAYGGVEGNYIYYNAVDTETTYHITLIGTYGVTNGMIDMTVDTLDENGNVVESKKSYLILMNQMYASSGVGPEHIRVEANTVVDNVKVTVLKPDSLGFVSPPQTVAVGSTTEIKAKYYRDGEELDYDAPIEYSVTGDAVSISADGVITVAENAPEQNITVTAKNGDIKTEAQIKVVSGVIFTINTALFNEEGTALEAVSAVKNYFYNNNAVFVVTAYDENGTLQDCFVKNVPAKAISAGEDTEIILDYTLPENFNRDTWLIEIQAWGASEATTLPETKGEIAIRRFFEENGGAVEWIGEHSVVAGMINGKTAVLQIGNSNVFVNGESYTISTAPYVSEDWVTYVGSELVDLMR